MVSPTFEERSLDILFHLQIKLFEIVSFYLLLFSNGKVLDRRETLIGNVLPFFFRG